MEQQQRESQNNQEKAEQVNSQVQQENLLLQEQNNEVLEPNQEQNENQAQEIDIKIRTMDLNQIDIRINLTSTVAQLKNLLQQRMHIPIQYQRIIYQGKLLKNPETLNQYKLQNGSILQLVANPSEEQLPVINPEQQQVNFDENNNPDEFIAGILRSALEPSLRRRRQLRQHRILDAQESLEIIRQSLMTVQQLFDTMNTSQECINGSQPNVIQPFNISRKKLQIGQWIDVKDTVDQWLEAQVIDVSESQNGQKVYVHYNGWPSHWDEWIESKSVRIAPFRTYTVQSSTCPFLSPSPTVNPDGMQNQQQQQHAMDLISQLGDFMEETKTMLTKFYNQYSTIRQQNQANQHLQNLEESKTQNSGQQRNEEQKLEESIEEQNITVEASNSLTVELESAEQKSLTSLSELIQCEEVLREENSNRQTNFTSQHEYMLISAQLSPVLDRLGRILTDFAPHLANIANARIIGDDSTSNSSMFTNEGSVQPNYPRVGQSVPVMQNPSELTRPLEGNVDIFIHAVISPQSSLLGGLRNNENGQQQNREQNQHPQQQQQAQSAQRFPGIQQEIPQAQLFMPNYNQNLRNNSSNIASQIIELEPQQVISQQQQNIMPNQIISQSNQQESIPNSQTSQSIKDNVQDKNNSNEERERNESSCTIY